MPENVGPVLVNRETFTDSRGSVLHFRDFVLGDIKRVYFIVPELDSGFRGWHGHRYESKSFLCVQGSFEVSSVHVTDWVKGVASAPAQSWILSASEGQLLVIPEGHANGMRPLEAGSKLMVMSNKTLQESLEDDIRFPESSF